MHAVNRLYWLKAVLVTLLAFALGVVVYVSVGIIMARGEVNANAAWHQITIQSAPCDCITEFVPVQHLPGSGTLADPYVTYNSHVPVLVGVSGMGLVTVRDQFGDVLWSFDKVTPGFTEFEVPIDLLHGLGLYSLSVFLDGIEALGPNVESPMWIDYRALPVPPKPPKPPVEPDVPDTGSYLYIGGYAVQTYGATLAGVAVAALVFGIFVIIALKRRKQEEKEARSNAAFGKKMKREVTGGKIAKAGLGKKKAKK